MGEMRLVAVGCPLVHVSWRVAASHTCRMMRWGSIRIRTGYIGPVVVIYNNNLHPVAPVPRSMRGYLSHHSEHTTFATSDAKATIHKAQWNTMFYVVFVS
jgi:hypothetical protein